MNDYEPESSLGWLDFDAAASERVSTLLRSLEEPSTLDVLGLGSIRDALADMLTPGTSTVQTRLRYFILLPWIFQDLDAKGVPEADFARQLRDAEASLIDRLYHLGPNQGVIGYYAKRNLRRMPSDIYWGGLGAWEIRQLGVSLAEYPQRKAALGRFKPERDDDGNAATRARSLWTQMPPPPAGFLEANLDFTLRPEEADFLIERIRRRHPHTLLAVLSDAPKVPDNVSYPWDLPTGGMPVELIEILRHARCFSELTLGPQLVYNLLLAREARSALGWDTKELEDEQIAQLDEWCDAVSHRREDLHNWVDDLPEFWQILKGHRISETTKRFWSDVVLHSVTDPSRFADDDSVHKRIRDRERQLKSQRARLTCRSALENWNGRAVGGQLDYRWTITKQYLKDIAASEVDL